MSDALKPAMHGRDHCPGGADPIPCLSDATTPWMVVNYSDADGWPSGSSKTTLNLDPSIHVTWGTSDTTVFGLADDGGGNFLLEFLDNGLFVAHAGFLFVSNSAPAAGSVGQLDLSGANTTIAGASAWPWVAKLSGAYQAQGGQTVYYNLPSASITPPYYSGVSIGQNSGHTVTGVAVSILIYRLDTAGSTDF